MRGERNKDDKATARRRNLFFVLMNQRGERLCVRYCVRRDWILFVSLCYVYLSSPSPNYFYCGKRRQQKKIHMVNMATINTQCTTDAKLAFIITRPRLRHLQIVSTSARLTYCQYNTYCTLITRSRSFSYFGFASHSLSTSKNIHMRHEYHNAYSMCPYRKLWDRTKIYPTISNCDRRDCIFPTRDDITLATCANVDQVLNSTVYATATKYCSGPVKLVSEGRVSESFKRTFERTPSQP